MTTKLPFAMDAVVAELRKATKKSLSKPETDEG